MPLSNYDRVVQVLEPDQLYWIINNMLNHRAIAKLCNTCGLSYAGIRTKSVPTETLIDDLVSEFYDQPDSGSLILKTLAKKIQREQDEIHQQSSKEIANWLASAPFDGNETESAKWMLALALDEREAVNQKTGQFMTLIEEQTTSSKNLLDNLLEQLHQDTKSIPSIEQEVVGIAPDTDLGALEEELEVVIDQLQQKEKELDKTRAREERLQHKYDTLQDQFKRLQLAYDELKQENSRSLKRLEENETQIRHLNKQIERYPALNSQVHQLERENRKLRYDLKKMKASEPVAPSDLQPFVQSLQKTVAGFQSGVNDTVNQLQEQQREIRSALDEICQEIHTLRVETQREKEKKLDWRRPKGTPERVGVFVDVQNMFYAARQQGARLDFEKLLHVTVDDRRLIRAIAYVVQTPEVDQSGFVSMLQQRSYQVKRKDLRLRSDGSAKGDWDMGMAIDMISLADKLDVIVLVSGDGDFVSLVNLLKEIGPRVEVLSFPHNTARDLMEVADCYYPIVEDMLIKMDPE